MTARYWKNTTLTYTLQVDHYMYVYNGKVNKKVCKTISIRILIPVKSLKMYDVSLIIKLITKETLT